MAARRAFDSGEWSALDPVERAARVMELADLIQASIAELALLEALDSGGLVARTGSDVFQGARFLRETARYAAHQFPWTERVPGKSPFFPASNSVRREPRAGRVCASAGKASEFRRGCDRIHVRTSLGYGLADAHFKPHAALRYGEKSFYFN